MKVSNNVVYFVSGTTLFGMFAISGMTAYLANTLRGTPNGSAPLFGAGIGFVAGIALVLGKALVSKMLHFAHNHPTITIGAVGATVAVGIIATIYFSKKEE
ncbi:MAG: hypothetical protein K940chlam8_00472 [Chlamydiae bacterium]|nr:hypothetical protein [Chlamydiota bacterium]